MSRPKKERELPKSRRTPDAGKPIGLDGNFAKRYVGVWSAKMDPLNESPDLVNLLGPIICGSAGESEERELLEYFTKLILNATPEETEKAFNKILKIKRNVMLGDRRAYALMAYSHYFDEAGKEPSKAKLKAYMIARKDIYKDQPGPEEPWTRLWKETGLFGMSDR